MLCESANVLIVLLPKESDPVIAIVLRIFLFPEQLLKEPFEVAVLDLVARFQSLYINDKLSQLL